MKKVLTTLLGAILFVFVSAHEGMWIPSLLQSLNEADMQKRGLKLTAEDIYSINQSSLKDAVVHFGGYCTAEVVSDQGLIFTNHHCGFGAIQKHSTLEHNYLKDGFWAKDFQSELPNEGLFVTFIRSIEDVTAEVLNGADGKTVEEREAIIKANIQALKASKKSDRSSIEINVKAFDYGNAYYLFTTEKYNDVRLVGTPPSSIGKYGHDTDNWVWPRHTGDFSVFRIYADENNQAAAYNENNKPYTPMHSFPISLKPLMKDDFTMVYGFPGRTEHYLTASEVDYVVTKGNPAKISLRTTALDVINAYMMSDELISIQYASKQSRIANAWKKWKGQNMGLIRFKAVEEKKEKEQAFLKAYLANGGTENDNVLTALDALMAKTEKERFAYDVFTQYYFIGPEIYKFLSPFAGFAKEAAGDSVDYNMWKQKLQTSSDKFFKDFNQDVDKELFANLTEEFFSYLLPEEILTESLTKLGKSNKGKWTAYAENLYAKSMFTSREKVNAFIQSLGKSSAKKMAKDPYLNLRKEMLDFFIVKVQPTKAAFDSEKEFLMYEYVKLQRELFKDQTFWYDANSTLRLTYGKVEGTEPQDGLIYKHYTTIEGVMDKYKPNDYEYDLPKELLTLYNNKDYGQYADESGDLRVCFLASNHTTGGNSGSPVINGNGELIGINFDRTWESTMSDIRFSPEICRNISVDVHYVLFVIEKLGGANRLIEEMNIVR